MSCPPPTRPGLPRQAPPQVDGARVIEVRQDGVCLADDDFIPSELVVWAAGVKGPDLLQDLDDLEASRSNQLVVTPTLQTTRDPDVFAIGDCAFLINPGETRPVPPRAQAAHQQARACPGASESTLRWRGPALVRNGAGLACRNDRP